MSFDARQTELLASLVERLGNITAMVGPQGLPGPSGDNPTALATANVAFTHSGGAPIAVQVSADPVPANANWIWPSFEHPIIGACPPLHASIFRGLTAGAAGDVWAAGKFANLKLTRTAGQDQRIWLGRTATDRPLALHFGSELAAADVTIYWS